MSSGNTKKLNQGNNGDRKGKRKVFNDGYNSSNQSLESGADNSMLASQEIQGPASPAKTLGNSVVFEKLEEKEKGKEKTDQQQQSRQKSSVHLFTTNVKPRLRWTTKLHAHFVDAINKLGGPQKATPKTLWDAMALEGLDLHHVKSHLQKYRMGKLTVRDWPDVPRIRTSTSKPSTGVSIGTSARNLPFQAYGDGRFKGNKVKKTYKPEMEVQGQGQLYMKLKDAEYQRHLNDLIQAAQKKLSNQYISGAHAVADAAGIFRKILAGEKTMATTPSLYSALENTYPKYDTLDKIKGCLVIPKQVSSSATYQPQNLVDSATQDFITSQGYLYPIYNSNDAINAHAGLQEQTPSFLSQNAAYTSQPHTTFSGFQPQSAAHEFHPQTESYSASSGFPTSLGSSSGNAEYLQGFQPPSTSYTFQPQNVFNNYQSQNACSFQLQNPTYNYQPQSSAYSNQPQNVAYAYPPQNAAAYVFQPQNTASSATNNLPTSNANYSETAYLDDLTAALAAIGSTSVAALLEDPVDSYMVWDNPEPNANDNGNNGHLM